MRYRVLDWEKHCECVTLASFDNLDDAFAFADVSRAYYIVDDVEDKFYMPQHRLFHLEDTLDFYSNRWICTDPDNYQFCRKIDETTFEYIQLKPYYYERLDGLKPEMDVLEYLSGKTFKKEWYHSIIDVTSYSPEEIAEYVAPYGMPEVDNQLIAECIFETDWCY